MQPSTRIAMEAMSVPHVVCARRTRESSLSLEGVKTMGWPAIDGAVAATAGSASLFGGFV